MTGHVTAAVARERRFDLQGAAGCCTKLLQHRRALAEALRGCDAAVAWLRDHRQPVVVAESDGRVAGWARVTRS